LFQARKHRVRTFSQVKGSSGAVTAFGEESVFIAAQGGQIEVMKLRYEGGKKQPAAQCCAQLGLGVGAMLGE